MSSLPAGRFVKNSAGITAMLNMGGVQSACLGVADAVAAGARCYGYPVATDVRPGKKRCHARASVDVEAARASMGRDYYRALHGALPTARDALADAARTMG